MAEERAERPKFEVAAIGAKQMFLQCSEETIWNKEIGFAMQILRGNELLQKCDPQTIKNAVVNLALTGVSLNPALALAYLVPRDGKCVLDFSYRGMLKIATDSGSVKSIQAAVVYDFDEFQYEEGTVQFIHFKRSLDPPKDFKEDPLKTFWPHLICAFSIATLHDGSKDYMIMPKWRIEKIRNTSKIKSEKGPWGQFPEEMARKSVIKYHYKTLPQTDRMSEAVHILNEAEGLEIKTAQDRANDIKDLFRVDETVIETEPVESSFQGETETEQTATDEQENNLFNK